MPQSVESLKNVNILISCDIDRLQSKCMIFWVSVAHPGKPVFVLPVCYSWKAELADGSHLSADAGS